MEKLLFELYFDLRKTWVRLLFYAFLMSVGALALSYLIAPTYTSVSRILPPQQGGNAASMLQSLGALGGAAGAAAGIKNPADQYVSFLRSQTLQDAVIKNLDLKKRYGTEFNVDARLKLSANTRISLGKDAIISIEADDFDPKFCAALVNQHVDALRNLLASIAVSEAQQRRAFYEKQLKEAMGGLSSAEAEMAGAGLSMAELRTIPTAEISNLALLESKVAALNIRIATLSRFQSDQSYELISAKTEMAALQQQIRKNQSAGIVENDVNTKSGYFSKYRQLKYYEYLYEFYSKQYEMAKLDEAKEGATLQVLDVGLVPERKSKPKRALITVTVLLFGILVQLLYKIITISVVPGFQWRLKGYEGRS